MRSWGMISETIWEGFETQVGGDEARASASIQAARLGGAFQVGSVGRSFEKTSQPFHLRKTVVLSKWTAYYDRAAAYVGRTANHGGFPQSELGQECFKDDIRPRRSSRQRLRTRIHEGSIWLLRSNPLSGNCQLRNRSRDRIREVLKTHPLTCFCAAKWER